MTTPTELMETVIEMSRGALETPGQRPFAAIVVHEGRIIGRGINRVAERSDPTAHGEVEAIRDACASHGPSLAGCDLYTSCEPCIMCAAAAELAGISRIFYAASFAGAGEALAPLWPDFVPRYTAARAHVCQPPGQHPDRAIQIGEEPATAILKEWAQRMAGSRQKA